MNIMEREEQESNIFDWNYHCSACGAIVTEDEDGNVQLVCFKCNSAEE